MSRIALGLLTMITLVSAVGAQEPAAQPGAAASGAAPPTPSATTPGPAAGGSAQAEAGEPRADTSAPAQDTGEASSSPAHERDAATAASRSPAARPAERPSRPASEGEGKGKGEAKGAKPGAVDRLELGVATVTGDREQPKVMYVVPWKKSDIGDLSGKPMNSLLDEALAPVDRDEFRREVMYYNVVKADAAQNGASGPPPSKAEK